MNQFSLFLKKSDFFFFTYLGIGTFRFSVQIVHKLISHYSSRLNCIQTSRDVVNNGILMVEKSITYVVEGCHDISLKFSNLIQIFVSLKMASDIWKEFFNISFVGFKEIKSTINCLFTLITSSKFWQINVCGNVTDASLETLQSSINGVT